MAQSTLTGRSPSLACHRFQVTDGEVRISAGANLADLAPIVVGMLDESAGSGPFTVRALGVDQTNESFIVDDRWIVKFIRLWGTADRASLLERALQESGSDDIPPFVGSLDWNHPDLGVSTIALVSGFISGTTDGWTWAADDVIASLKSGTTPSWPTEVGRLVARVHTDLNRADYDSAPGPEESAEQIAREVADIYTARDDSAAIRIRNRMPALESAIASVPRGWSPTYMVTHGDLHVGQIIRTADHKYYLLDFDGNPQWEPGPQLRTEPVERDLAHMLNSIDLVAVVAQKRMIRTSQDVWDWADRAGEEFLDAYSRELERIGSPISYAANALPALKAEQLITELRYAAVFLPEWEYAPNGVISHRYVSSSTLEELPWTPPNSSTT